ncbi:hypothetical protein KFK09_010605 [Dendrobium nobile]|uniref:Uncharacterized protein n=1 Tax=Dendrobium nobile TaxID=94219 RepID=A0A8T3BDG2_DENNO|nr:hypothetical protein KFK09_010605 [Dendrobium nobile]
MPAENSYGLCKKCYRKVTLHNFIMLEKVEGCKFLQSDVASSHFQAEKAQRAEYGISFPSRNDFGSWIWLIGIVAKPVGYQKSGLVRRLNPGSSGLIPVWCETGSPVEP